MTFKQCMEVILMATVLTIVSIGMVYLNQTRAVKSVMPRMHGTVTPEALEEIEHRKQLKHLDAFWKEHRDCEAWK